MFGSSEDEQVIVLCSLSGAYSSQWDAVFTSTSCLSHVNKKYFVPVIETVCFENNARDGGSESRASGRSRTGCSRRLGCVPTNHRLLLAEATGLARRSEPERVIRGMSRAIYQNLPPPMGHLHTHTHLNTHTPVHKSTETLLHFIYLKWLKCCRIRCNQCRNQFISD